MHDNAAAVDTRRPAGAEGLFGRQPPKKADDESASCLAYSYLRGLHDRALAVEFRLRTGNREFLPYALLGPWRYNPSVGLLLKFSGDNVTLVLIRGSNLDVVVNDAVNLTDRGLQRHRILAVREMDEDAIGQAGEGQPTIDGIDIGEFETAEEQRAWLTKVAPAFLRPPA
jgi:hypothetical protein